MLYYSSPEIGLNTIRDGAGGIQANNSNSTINNTFINTVLRVPAREQNILYSHTSPFVCAPTSI